MSVGSLENLIKETRAAFIIAKSDGNLTAAEVIHIGIEVSQKLHHLGNLSGSEKKAVLLLALRKGLETSGGLNALQAFAGASDEAKKEFEEHLLTAASTAVAPSGACICCCCVAPLSRITSTDDLNARAY
jgi:hypothetical protein